MGREETVRTKNLVVADGGTPFIPGDTTIGERLFHASESKRRLEKQFPDRLAPYHFNIVGAGQTTADLFVFLSSQYPEASITVSLRGFAMRPEDDTHFVNELFSPEMPDWFYSTSAEAREKVLRDYASAAHSGASYDLIPRIYRTRYEARVVGSDRYRFDRLVQYVGGASGSDHAEVRYRSVEDGTERCERYDAVILATGYRYPTPLSFLQGAADLFETDDTGRYLLNRDYSVRTADSNGPKVFLQGYAESTHGFSEILLSLMPHRAAEIVESAAEASAYVGLTERVA
jgi:L-ornithine N5-oxygenase